MGSRLGAIASEYAHAAVPKCREHDCRIDLAGLPRHVILKGEILAGQGVAACDCIIFDAGNELTASLIEVKSSSLQTDHIKRQFESGGKKVLEMTASLGQAEPVLVVALIAKKYSRWFQHNKLRRMRVQIGQKKYPVMLCACGAKLVDIQRRFPALRKPGSGNAGKRSRIRK